MDPKQWRRQNDQLEESLMRAITSRPRSSGDGNRQSSPAEVGHSFLHPTNTATIAELDALRRFKTQATLELTDAREAVRVANRVKADHETLQRQLQSALSRANKSSKQLQHSNHQITLLRTELAETTSTADAVERNKLIQSDEHTTSMLELRKKVRITERDSAVVEAQAHAAMQAAVDQREETIAKLAVKLDDQAERIIQQQTELDALERAKLVEKQQREAVEKDLQEVVQQGAGVCAELEQMQMKLFDAIVKETSSAVQVKTALTELEDCKAELKAVVASSQAESAELAALKGTTEGELRNKLVEQRKQAEQETSQHKSEIRTVQVASKKRAKQIQDLEKELQAIAAHRKAKQKYDKEMEKMRNAALKKGSLRVTDPQLQLAANNVAAENKELQTQLEVVQTAFTETQHKLTVTEADLEVAQRELDMVKEAGDTMHRLMMDKQELEVSLEEALAEKLPIDSLQKKLGEITSENSRLRGSLEVSEAELEASADYVDAAELKLAEMDTQYTAKHQEADRWKQRSIRRQSEAAGPEVPKGLSPAFVRQMFAAQRIATIICVDVPVRARAVWDRWAFDACRHLAARIKKLKVQAQYEAQRAIESLESARVEMNSKMQQQGLLAGNAADSLQKMTVQMEERHVDTQAVKQVELIQASDGLGNKVAQLENETGSTAGLADLVEDIEKALSGSWQEIGALRQELGENQQKIDELTDLLQQSQADAAALGQTLAQTTAQLEANIEEEARSGLKMRVAELEHEVSSINTTAAAKMDELVKTVVRSNLTTPADIPNHCGWMSSCDSINEVADRQAVLQKSQDLHTLASLANESHVGLLELTSDLSDILYNMNEADVNEAAQQVAAMDATAAALGIGFTCTPRTDLVHAYEEFKTASSVEASIQARTRVLAAREQVNRLLTTTQQMR